MVTESDITERLVKILHERFGIEKSKLEGTARLTDLGLDSMLFVDVLLDLETELNARLLGFELPADATIQELCTSIAACVAPQCHVA